MDEEFNSQAAQGPRQWWSQVRRYGEDLYTSNALVRHLVNEPLFLGAISLFVVALLSVVLMIPKRWNPTPPGFSKTVRISLLDYVQAWSLRRAGAKAAAAHRWDEAIASYRGAVANNIADADSIRGLLQTLRDAPATRSANLGVIFATGDILLELSHTNRDDSLLLADVLERHRIASAAMTHLQPHADSLTPAEDLVYTRALLSSGQLRAFRDRWKTAPERYAADPLLRLYKAAFDAGWGGTTEAVQGLTILREQLANPTNGVMAARMLTAAALQREDLPSYETALQKLQEATATMAQDHAQYWEMLARAGRREEAVALAKAYGPIPPPTAVEMVQLARTWLALGLHDLAISTFRDHAERFGQSMDIWATYIDLLMLKKDWNEVRRVAAFLRANTTTRDILLPVTLYADIRADLAENRRIAVKESVSRLRQAPLPAPALALRFAAGLNAAGDHETAWHFLSQIETPLEDSPEYWLETVFAARGRKDLAALRRAADRLVQLSPNNGNALTIRLITLLGTRQDPSEALTTSLRLVNTGDRSASTLINHAMALLLNHRADEALAILTPLESNPQLDKDERNSLQIALADAYAQKDLPAEALRVGLHADPTVLLPPQEEWFRNLISECRRKSASNESRR